ncbi:unnamed protein product [Orchesella dallaii]|uniref:Uncharacterized protein n=1 Tax=Orchesella dallaii TaxID=48710 RepID=A0ABP1RIV3_9HEXA
MYESLSEIHSEFKTESTKNDAYEIGPYSRSKIYRLIFNGPGINYITDTVSTTPYDMDDVQIGLTLKQVYFLQDIDVVYTSDSVSRPSNIISELKGENPNINGGYGGSYVWLIPIWTTRLEDAASGIQIVIQDKENENYKDLAQGAGGAYRYIKIQTNSYAIDLITEIGMYRTSQEKDDPCNGGRWQFKTEDINSKRGKDNLYLVWNKRPI